MTFSKYENDFKKITKVNEYFSDRKKSEALPQINNLEKRQMKNLKYFEFLNIDKN